MFYPKTHYSLAIFTTSKRRGINMKIGYSGKLPAPDNSNFIEQLSELENYSCDRYEQETKDYTQVEDTLLFELINTLNKGDEILVCAFKYLAKNKVDLKRVLRQVEVMEGSIIVTGVDMTPSNLLQAYDEFNSYVHSYRIRNSDTPKQTKWQKDIRSMARSRLEQRGPFAQSYDDDIKKVITLITEEAAVRKRRAGRPKELTNSSLPQIRNDLANGLSVKEIAKSLGVSTRTIYRVIKKAT
jgi:DNA invertase Pin-like site-specific DNA recombinase